MKIYTTHYEKDGVLMDGDRVTAISFFDAQSILNATNRSHMIVDGILVGEVDADIDTLSADWDTYIDYEIYELN